MHVLRIQWLLVLSTILLLGCHPGVRVNKNPAHCDTGIRYYRPKPYLVLKPKERSETTGAGDKAKTIKESSDEFVEIGLEYLPDFSEEYSLQVKTGLGRANVGITLDQGWNLTGITQDLDSKFSENVGAIAELAKAASAFVATSDKTVAAPSRTTGGTQRWVVRATNVPLGYYEAVVNEDASGEKRLWGWRYVGFAPFNTCPTDISGSQSTCCDDPVIGAVYGLAFEEGVMVFKQLNNLRGDADAKRIAVDTGLMTVTTGSPDDDDTDDDTPPVSKEEAFKQKVAASFKEAAKIVVPVENIELELQNNKDLLVKLKLASADHKKVTKNMKALRKLEGALHMALSADALQDFESAMLAFQFVKIED